jgi:hypothetical protein
MRLSRMSKLMAEKGIKFQGTTLLRGAISCAIDVDDSFYVIVSFGGVSFLFLGGIQKDYQWTMVAMIITYFVASLGETIKVLLALGTAKRLADVVVTSDLMKSQLRNVSTQLKPSNVYEDLGRGWVIVLMTFITQCILIAFVVSALFFVCRLALLLAVVVGQYGIDFRASVSPTSCVL